MNKYPQDLAEKVYNYVSENEEERVCDAIAESSCREVPGNFLLNALNGFSSKLAEQLASPTLIIPWVFALIGVPPFFNGLLVPVKNTGSLLPQLVISGKIRAYQRRKYFWAGAALVQAVMMLVMAVMVDYKHPNLVGWIFISALTIFSIASGVASISFKDVMGKTIPKGKRGRLLGLRATGGGVLTGLVGLAFYLFLSDAENTAIYSWLFIGSAILWVTAAALFFFIDEAKGATSGGRTPVEELTNGWKLLKRNVNYRRFLISRGLLLSIPLVQPFLIVYANEKIGISVSGMGLFVLLTGISNAVSSPFWGRFADRSSKKLMVIAGVLGAMVCGYVVVFQYLPIDWQNIYTFSPVFVLMIMVYGGARMARKTYLVDYAPKDERPLYVSMANTTIGLFVLASGGLSLIANYFGVVAMIAVLAGMMVLASLSAIRLKDV